MHSVVEVSVLNFYEKCVYVFELVTLDQNARDVLVCVLRMIYGMCVLAVTTSLQC